MIWRQLIQDAMMNSNLVPVGNANDPAIAERFLSALQYLLSDWSRDGFLEPAFQEMTSTLIGGQNVYSAGPSGDFPNRPVELFQCILSGASLGQVRYPFLVQPWDEFQAITFPSAQGIPTAAFYNPTYPLGTIAFYPTPNETWDCKFLGQFAWDSIDPNAQVSLPPGYDSAISDNLAVWGAINYNRPISPDLRNRARAGKAALRVAMPTKDKARDNQWAWRWRPVRNWQTDSPR